MTKRTDPVKPVKLCNGVTRYRFVVDVGRDPVTGKRKQKTFTFDTKREASEEYHRIKHETALGTYVRPSKVTVNEYLDGWFEGVTRDLKPGTVANYRDALKPVRARLGDRPVQSITKADVEKLVTWMLTSGRRRGGTPGTGLSGRSARATLARFTAALTMAQQEGVVVRNVAALVVPPKHVPTEREPWSADEVRQFLAVASADRLHAAWRLSLYGLRRGEVLGLRWSEDVDLDAGTIRIAETRVMVDGKVVIGTPKSRNGQRRLPMDAELVKALRALRAHQAAERLAAGSAYADSGRVVVDELGGPIWPEWYSDEFGRVIRAAGVRRITLHDSRHTTLTLMEHAGVPISIISRWAGHYDPSFTYSKYVHAADEDLKTGTEAIAGLYN